MARVLYICPSAGVGGAETFLKQTYLYSNSDQFENHYLLFRTGPLHDWLKQKGAKVHLLSSPPRISSASDRKKVALRMKELINQFNFDLVHSTMAYAALFAAPICKKMQVPHVWFQHGPASGWMDRMAAVLNHQGLIVNSHYTGRRQRQLENPLRFLIPRKNPIEKILLGTDEIEIEKSEVKKFKQSLFQTHNIDGSPLCVGMLCRIQEWKGVHLFIEALDILKSESSLPPFVGLVFGEPFKDEKYYKNLLKQASEKKIPVQFCGHTDKTSLALASCDVLVNASIQPEPFGLSIIEAMMVGTVPVVPDEGGPVEIVTNGKHGLVFKAQDSEALARQVKTLILDTELRQRLSTNAKEVARQKFTAKRAISHLETFHTKIIGT